jgi:hypothetical protein
MEELPLEPQVSCDPVNRIAGDGEVYRSEVDADLVRPPGLQPDAEKRVLRQQVLELEVGHGGAGRVSVERVAEAVVPVAADRCLDRSAPRARLSGGQREVFAGQLPAPHEPLQSLVDRLGARDDEQARRVAVEPVDDPWTVLLPARSARRRERVGERPARVAARRMDDDARGLVDDEQVLVRVGDGELGRRNGRLGGSRSRRLNLDLLPSRELVALADRSAVDEDGTGREEPLGGRPRSDVRQRRKVPIEPLARCLRRDEVPLQRLDAAPFCRRGWGLPSARASAPTRMATPITMKLSARLNAGQ